jgi:hypothetical protein
MGQITADQSQQVIAALATNVDWSSIDFETHELQEAIIRNPVRAGKQFELFLKNRARLIIGDPKSLLTKPFNPVEFLGKDWATWRGSIDGNGLSGEEDIDSRTLAITEVELAKFVFETCLKAGEKSVSGEEKLRRLKEKPEFIRFGGSIFHALWLDYQTYKENSILEWLYRNLGVTFMDFMGQVLRFPNGDRYVLYLDRNDDGKWRWRYGWLGSQWLASYPSVGCASPPLVIES